MDQEQNVSATFTDIGCGQLEVNIRRELETTESSNDYVIPVGTTFRVGWVIRTDSNLSQKHWYDGNSIEVTLEEPEPRKLKSFPTDK